MPPTPIDWLPIYPAQVRSLKLQPRVRPSVVYTANFIPIPIPGPPTDWAIPFNAPPPHRRSQRPQPTRQMVGPLTGALTTLGWLPIYPAPRRSPPRRQSAGAVAPSPAIVQVPKTYGWHPTYPTMPRRLSVCIGGSRTYVVPLNQPVPPPGPNEIVPPTCLSLGLETWTPPTVTSPTLLLPLFISEAWIAPTLGEEDLC